MDLGPWRGMLGVPSGMPYGGEASVGFIEGLLHFISSSPPGYNVSGLVRGDLAPVQGLQGAMANYLIDDLLGAGYNDQDVEESAMEMASSLIDGITFDEVMQGNASSSLVQPTEIDDLIWRRLVEHSRRFLDLVIACLSLPSSCISARSAALEP